ncbi:MAG: putative quinol monooxygenase [Pseudomonadales bacterium]
MPIIVAGSLKLKPGTRDEFIEKSLDAISQARELDACEDFSVSPDPLDENRVNVFEKWSSRTSLAEFRNSGPDNDSFSLVESFNVNEYEIST